MIQDLLILTNISPGNGQAVTRFFTRKKSDLYRSGITWSDYVQIDDTGARGAMAPTSIVFSSAHQAAYVIKTNAGKADMLSGQFDDLFGLCFAQSFNGLVKALRGQIANAHGFIVCAQVFQDKVRSPGVAERMKFDGSGGFPCLFMIYR